MEEPLAINPEKAAEDYGEIFINFTPIAALNEDVKEPPATNPEQKTEIGGETFENPMHIAAINGDEEAIVALKKARVKLNQTENGQTPLHVAVIRGKVLAVKKLISLGATISKTNKDGCTSLHLAVLHNHVSLIDVLMDCDTARSHVNTFNRSGNAPLHFAITMGNVDAVRALLIRGANADLKNKTGDGPLHIALMQGNPDMIDAVIKYVKKPNIFDKNKFRPLHLAVLHNRIDAIKKFGELQNIKMNYLNGDGDSALHLAAKLGNVDAIKELYGLGANMSIKNTEGLSPIHLAVICDARKAIKILVKLGALINDVDRFGNTPMHLAATQKNVHALRLLLRLKAEVNTKNAIGDYPLHSAVMANCRDAIKQLLIMGANSWVYNATGMTPFHVAVSIGNRDLIEVFFHYRPTTCSRSYANGDLPLHSAAKFCNSVGIETLIEFGENFCEKNSLDLTPLDIIMLYVSENTFDTAVKALTDQHENNNLKKKNSLSSYEILKSARLIFKCEVLRNFEHSRLNEPEYVSNIVPVLRSYINECFAEVRIMKSSFLYRNFPFYAFVIHGWDEKMPFTRAFTSEVALSHILHISKTNVYPIYRHVIAFSLERSVLLKKILSLRIWVRNNRKTCVDVDAALITKYLNNNDILNLFLAYSDLDTDGGNSESSNDNKRKIAEFKLSYSSDNMEYLSVATGKKKIKL